MEHGPFWEADSRSDRQKISPNFMEPLGSIRHSQRPAISPYPDPDESSTQRKTLFP